MSPFVLMLLAIVFVVVGCIGLVGVASDDSKVSDDFKKHHGCGTAIGSIVLVAVGLGLALLSCIKAFLTGA
jgi:hypothetical protein